jgi:flagellar M-ring protein FliF
VDQLRQVLATIRKQLGGMNVSQKLLIGSLAVIALMTLFVVSQYAGRSELEPLLPPGSKAEDVDRALATLRAANFAATSRNGNVYVAPDRKLAAVAQLQLDNKMPQDPAALFRELLGKQSWTETREQTRQNYNAALQSLLALVIQQFPNVKSATVMMEVPSRENLGVAVPKPTASVAVTTQDGQPMPQRLVDAVAHLVAGAKAGLAVEQVRIIDTSGGRQRKPTSEDDFQASTYAEQAQKFESYLQQKLVAHLSYIPGVFVTVTADVDVTRHTTQTHTFLPEGSGTVSPVKRNKESVTTQADKAAGFETGVRPNTQADLGRGSGGAGSKSEQREEETERDPHVGSTTEQVVDSRGNPRRIAVSVNVPQGYVAGLLQPPSPDGKPPASAPDEAAIRKRFDETEQPRILASLITHVRAMTDATVDDAEVAKMVSVALVPMDVPLGVGGVGEPGRAGFLGAGSSGGAGLLVGSGGLVEKGVLAALAVVSLTMMLLMVRKAGRKAPMPSAEELVGIPPPLEARTDIVGEADETDAPMAGIELGDDEIKSRRLLEQVTDLVKENPESAAKLLNRWIQVEA